MKKKKKLLYLCVGALALCLTIYPFMLGNIPIGLFSLVSFASAALCVPLGKKLSHSGGKRREQSAMSAQSEERGGFAESVKTNVSFSQVAGMEEVIAELREIADFLVSPEKYTRFGAKIPRGVLFYGPPGTGKTMLAKALATESAASFIYASGSEFIEKFVGVGASRIRALFERAARRAPCIIFIDELDAIGVSRNTDNNSERDQTLNQLLIELDGFAESSGVVVIGATNRLDMLDEALIRAGRFDRHIYIGKPARNAREQILREHLREKPVSDSVDIPALAALSAGMSGAELSALANEAALLAVREQHDAITPEDIEGALLKTAAGLTSRSVVLGEADRRRVAVHEGGHAVLNIYLKRLVPELVTIIPRGQSLGLVLCGEGEERFLSSPEELMQSVAVLLGGRCAEMLLLGTISTGAGNDLLRANELAAQMVREYGMGTGCPNRVLARGESSEALETEIAAILKSGKELADSVLNLHSAELTLFADALFERGLLRRADIEQLVGRFAELV